MRVAFRTIRSAVRKVWWWLRQFSGDAAYENYLRWASRPPGTLRRAGPDASVVSLEQFYLEMLARRYARINRCC